MLYADNLCKWLEPRSGPKLYATLIVVLKEFFEEVKFEKKSADDNKSTNNYQRAITPIFFLKNWTVVKVWQGNNMGPLIQLDIEDYGNQLIQYM